MATKVKDGPPTKEKRGTSPSHTSSKDTIQKGKTPCTSKRSNSTSPSGRHIPNYLKPTISSGLDSSVNHVRKHAPGETLKPTISRRKSLDKPLAPSHVPKTRPSTITRDTKSQSSSRSVLHANASTKPLPDRLQKARSASTGKESRNHVRKQGNEPSMVAAKAATTKIVDIDQAHDTSSNIDHAHDIPSNKDHAHDIAPDEDNVNETPQIEQTEVKEEEFDSSVAQIQEEPKDENHKGKEVIVVEDNYKHIKIQPEIEEEEITMHDSSIVSKDINESLDQTTEKQDESFNENTETSKENAELKQTISHLEETFPSQVLENAIEEKEEEGQKEAFIVTSQDAQEKEKQAEGSKDVVKEEPESVKDEGKQEKHGAENAAVKHQVVQGKRESVVSNDVIEETAIKLREQRKNKVKALAGAFESVMETK